MLLNGIEQSLVGMESEKKRQALYQVEAISMAPPPRNNDTTQGTDETRLVLPPHVLMTVVV